MRIVILGNPHGWHVQQLAQAAGQLGHESQVIEFRRVVVRLEGAAAIAPGGRDLLAADRILTRAVPAGSLEQVVFRMDVLHRARAAGIPILNPPAAMEACVDKFLASARLSAAGIRIPRTIACEHLDDALAAFAELGGRAVIKPLFGSEGRGICLLEDPNIAYRILRAVTQFDGVVYLQEYVDHPGYDVRALVLGDRVLAAMRRVSGTDFRTNVARGARPEPYTLPPEWAELAIRSARAVGAPLAGVDLLTSSAGELFVIEVNSAPGFQALASTTAQDIPTAIIDFLVGYKGN